MIQAAWAQDLLRIIPWLVLPQESKPKVTEIVGMGEAGMKGAFNWTRLAHTSTPLQPGGGERKYLASLVAAVGN